MPEKELADKETKEEEEKQAPGPFLRLMVIIMILLFLTMLIPYYFVTIHVEPNLRKMTELFQEINVSLFSLVYQNKSTYDLAFTSLDHLDTYFSTTKGGQELAILRSVTTKITNTLCREYNEECYAKAIFYFVRDYIRYVKDPQNQEYIQNPLYTLSIRAGDCDDHAVLVSYMLSSIGIDNKFLYSENHIYNRVYITKKYLFGSRTYSYDLDATCKNCDFGQRPGP